MLQASSFQHFFVFFLQPFNFTLCSGHHDSSSVNRRIASNKLLRFRRSNPLKNFWYLQLSRFPVPSTVLKRGPASITLVNTKAKPR
ncbi:hypothetical protein EDB19DRAFT_980762 [Suillus lakei]|nr:hypothetical protein EDB19DRAFT_980762 [Suillus lakei]